MFIALVALTAVDENQLDRLLRYRPNALSAPYNSTSEKAGSNKTYTDEFGEIAARKIQQAQKRLTVAEIDGIVAEYQQGASTYALAEKYGCHRNTISSNLKKRGITVTHSKIEACGGGADIIALYKGGVNTTELAKRYSISHASIIKFLHDNGVEMRTRWDY
jgi:transposase-like protein